MHIYAISTDDLVKQENEVNDVWRDSGKVSDLMRYSGIIRELTLREHNLGGVENA